MLQWFYQWGSPKWFYERTMQLSPWLAALSILLLLTSMIWGLVFAPPDYLQGHSFRIIYVHVPAAVLAQFIYVLIAGLGFISLVWKVKLADYLAKAAAPIGASFTVLALVSGAIWGKPTWGTWWVWDARLTSMLILLFLYLGILALHSAMENSTKAAKAAALLAIVGVLNIPIIKFSVEWWYTLHQPATFKLTEKPAMPIEMWLPLLISLIAFYVFFAWIWFMRAQYEILQAERRTAWVKTLWL